MHLIDIENLCGSNRPTLEQVRTARHKYFGTGLCREKDLVVIACSKGNYLSSACGWPNVRYLVRDGKNGADLCLAEVMIGEKIPQRFERVVVASGDGGLAPVVSSLAAHGVETVVVSQSNRLSRAMRMAAHRCHLLTPELEDIA